MRRRQERNIYSLGRSSGCQELDRLSDFHKGTIIILAYRECLTIIDDAAIYCILQLTDPLLAIVMVQVPSRPINGQVVPVSLTRIGNDQGSPGPLEVRKKILLNAIIAVMGRIFEQLGFRAKALVATKDEYMHGIG
jgi:hypothetical protein